MTPEELGRIREIYEQVLPMSAAGRQMHLDRECARQPDIREGVERLLEARESVPAWLERPAVGAAPPFVPTALPPMEGRHLSGYTLVREIGRGGMGAVYLAERSDETFHRRAAIKLVFPPAHSATVLARFQQEREILASLDHPNIAKLLDAGVTGEGWPYFVMEYVDGQPIHRWCDERKLNINQRLELFRGVIDAVRYAHRHLVVHRDLKPGNIFVTGEGVVKLLDFGIAKVLVPNQDGKAPATETLAAMMTPEYASPEQVNGAAITTLTDVYSLGVVLYELLTGHRPYRLKSAAMHELARVIAEEEPARPSDVVTIHEPAPGPGQAEITPGMVSAVREGEPDRLRRRLAGDLDSIVMMALRKEPERRYGSVESFAEDLQRHLDQRPVHAREASPWERFQHFRRRSPGAFLAAGLIAILFIAGLLAVFLQVRHDILAARLERGLVPFVLPLWLFSSGIAAAALWAAAYFVRPQGAQRLGAAIGGLVFGLGLAGRLRLEHSLGLWQSRVDGNRDPLLLLSPAIWFPMFALSAALLLVLLMIGRRFGGKGQVLSLVVLGLIQATRERFWFGEFIPALDFQPGWVPILSSAGMILAAGLLGLLTMRLMGGVDGATRGRT